MSIADRIQKILTALKAVSWDLVIALLVDIKEATVELWAAITSMSLQGAFNAAMRLVGLAETLWAQVGKALTDILDAIRTTNTGSK